jgi:hypothetical protein
MKIIAVVLIAVVAGTVAACGTASTVTVAASPAVVPAGQPGASPPPSAACLTAGNCTVSQQQQVATSEGITNPGGLNGCLVTGDCTASQQKGIAAGISAGDSSGQLPAPTLASSCLLGANGEDVEVGVGNPTVSCAQWITNLAVGGLNWYPINSMVPPGQVGTAANQEIMQQACDLTDGTQELYVEDGGFQVNGDDICSTEEQNGWTPESPPGPLAQQAQQQAQQAPSSAAP